MMAFKSWKSFCILGMAMVFSFSNTLAFLDFEPEIIHQSYENYGYMSGQPQLPYGGDHYSFCQQAYPNAAYINNAETRFGRINWDLDTPFGSVDTNIIYCDAEIEGYGRRYGHFALSPDGLIYELQQEGNYYYPIYNDY